MKAVRGHAPKRHRVFPVPVKLKKPKLEPLPLVRVKETQEIGFMRKITEEFVVVFLQSGKWAKFGPNEVEEVELMEKTKKKEEAENG